MLRTTANILDKRGQRIRFGQYVQMFKGSRYKPNATSPNPNRNRLLAPNVRMPLLDPTKIAAVSSLPLQQEHLAVETEIKKLDYQKPTSNYYKLASQPLKHKLLLAHPKKKLDKFTKSILLNPNSVVDDWPDFVGRDEYKCDLPAWNNKSGDNSWYPSGMRNAMSRMKGTWHKYDMVIEVHDARLPFTGRNKSFYETFRGKPYSVFT